MQEPAGAAPLPTLYTDVAGVAGGLLDIDDTPQGLMYTAPFWRFASLPWDIVFIRNHQSD